MSHAMLAKDSMLDLEALARETDVSSPDSKQCQSAHNGNLPLEAERPETLESANSIAETSVSSIGTHPQQPPLNDSSGSYPGFTAGYDPTYDDSNDVGAEVYSQYEFHDSYATLYLGEKQQNNNFWCCLFPWMNQLPASKSASSFQPESYEAVVNEPAGAISSRDNDADEVASNSSELLGERLSEKERQAVLARLGLAEPDASPEDDLSVEDKKGLLNGLSERSVGDDASLDSNSNSSGGRKKGILRRKSTVSKKEKNGGKRRSLFPVYESSTSKHNPNNVSFQPMARVLTVKSKNDMLPGEKGDIWWQKSDYEDFRKTGRIITRAMLEGGSEIWLALNESWRAGPDASRSTTLKTAVSMADPESKSSSSTKNGATGSESADKWWHAFGHSRRGLEHVVSMEEGRQRQGNVRRAIKAVMEEQARQKLYHREDPEKLRMVSLNHTSWARDLALACGASDADAVKSSFAADRKSREFFLLKLARNTKTPQTTQTIPQFMQPAVAKSAARLSTAQRLDAHTAAQIRYRRKVVDEPLRDGLHDNTLSHRAAGFSATRDKVNMAAVLTGMGTVAS